MRTDLLSQGLKESLGRGERVERVERGGDFQILFLTEKKNAEVFRHFHKLEWHRLGREMQDEYLQ